MKPAYRGRRASFHHCGSGARPPRCVPPPRRQADFAGAAAAPIIVGSTHAGRGGRVAEGGGLLNRCTGLKPVPGVRIPPSPPYLSLPAYCCILDSVPPFFIILFGMGVQHGQRLEGRGSLDGGVSELGRSTGQHRSLDRGVQSRPASSRSEESHPARGPLGVQSCTKFRGRDCLVLRGALQMRRPCCWPG